MFTEKFKDEFDLSKMHFQMKSIWHPIYSQKCSPDIVYTKAGLYENLKDPMVTPFRKQKPA